MTSRQLAHHGPNNTERASDCEEGCETWKDGSREERLLSGIPCLVFRRPGHRGPLCQVHWKALVHVVDLQQVARREVRSISHDGAHGSGDRLECSVVAGVVHDALEVVGREALDWVL